MTAKRTCLRCGKPIWVEKSVVAGMGPLCLAKVQLKNTHMETGNHFDLPFDFDQMNILFKRSVDGLHFNIPQVHVCHSPGGFEWGYNGSGPADFALNILAVFLPAPPIQKGRVFPFNPQGKMTTAIRVGGTNRKNSTVVSVLAWDLHQKFKSEVIATLPTRGGRIKGSFIKQWIEEHSDYRFTDR